jgi:hypothetical protein
MRNGRGNRSTRRNPAPVPLCPPQIPHDLTWARTRTAAVGSRRLTISAMARTNAMLGRVWQIIANFSSIVFQVVELQFDVEEIIHALCLQELFLKYFIASDLLTRLECVCPITKKRPSISKG